ncbi:MFS transporter [Aaosphaeria arxii CBS 175.79]|uniref:MFS transporter n=1 Tax=Aaosphaeria arxii CBS 175.79 TaxID=1450172 RepID=A0A6A5XXE9_9PLEO|nr:MFS transporter [Aaosphaeria arxii CBS 175.79]KAF2017832.1 MFS transporter [Aaosphaeria arxii CBS 175.79]
MQSFLQYHRFRKQVEQQYERHQEILHTTTTRGETAARERLNGQNPNLRLSHFSTSSSVSTSSSSDDDAAGSPSDLEKNEPSSEKQTYDTPTEEEAHEKIEPTSAPLAQESTGLRDNGRAQPIPPEDEYLSRIATVATHRTAGTAFGVTLTGIHVRSRTTHEGGEGKVFVVGYEGPDDPLNPHNWSHLKRIAATACIASIGFVVGFASAIDASALRKASHEFGVSEVVESLATGIFLIGFGFGALFAGPFSETVGRNPVYIATLTLYIMFIMASALAPNIGAQIAFRFIAGLFGATPLTCAGGSLSDMWSPMERVFAFPMFATAAFSGPIIGPVIGGFIAQSDAVSWRWVEWTTLIMSSLVLGVVVLFQPETYPPTLLKWKACHLRAVTGDQRYVAEIEIRGDSLLQRLGVSLYRPFLLTIHEPVIILLSLYMSVIYIVLFTFLEGYTFIFGEVHGVSPGITGLCFLSIEVGLFLAACLVPLIYKWARRDLKKIKEAGGSRLPPEFRLWFAMLGGAPAIPISLFWMGWTSYSHISIWSSLGASTLFGYGTLCIFISSYQYIIDVYESFAASALTFLTLSRYVVAGGMTVAGVPFYKDMGVQYTLTILGGLSVLLVPVPYLFFIYGKKIRNWSKFAVARE